MINGLFGLPGAGKTLHLAYIADRAIHKKSMSFGFLGVHRFSNINRKKHPYDRVYTTFPMVGAYKLDYETFGKQHYDNSLLVIDEIMMFSDSRDFKSFTPELKFFWSQHRHFGCDIVYASQSYDDMDKKIRNLTDSYYYIDSYPIFSISKPIRASFDIKDGQIRQGFEFAHWLFNFWYVRKWRYKLVDTNFSVKMPELSLNDSVMW